ncbi:MAG TPA: YciC family protein [Solirubrobacterales bacterium]|nr:YciC family protein [Solirubrobacterales bacterium]
MSRRAQLVSIYARIGRTYWRWAPSLLQLAVVVFVPLGLVHSVIFEADLNAFDLANGLVVLAIVGAVLALAATGLVGEIFYTGAVSILLTHPHEGQPPSLRDIAGMIKYKPLIAIDLLYGLMVAVGLVLFFVPGVLVFVWLGLSAPVVEIEHRGVRDAFRRSIQLVRHKFWIVALVLIPIELVGDTLTNLATELTHGLVGSEFICEWLADVLANIAFTPFYAVAAVLLTVDLIREKGDRVELHPRPATLPSP